MTAIYKIVPAALWRAAEGAGVFCGTEDDRRDGSIHFSTAAQVPETAAKHFARQRDLLLVSLEAARLGPALKMGALARPRTVSASLRRVGPQPGEQDRKK